MRLHCISRLAVLLFPICLSAPSFAGPGALPESVENALRAAQIPVSAVAILAQPVSTPTPLVSINTRQAMNPASVMKLVTTYSALGMLGPAWQWKTGVWADQIPVNGVLNGPLYLKGSGDPKLAQEHLTGLLRKLRTQGIKRIDGGLVLDRSLYNLPPFNPADFDDQPMRPYNIGPDALLMNFRAVSLNLVVSAASEGVSVMLETPANGLSIDNRLKPGRGSCEQWKDAIQPQLQTQSGNWQLVLNGSYNPRCGSKTLNLAPLTENDYAAALIKALWQELGGELNGPVRNGTVPSNATLLAENLSPPLAEVIRDINKFSNNVMARQVFLSLAESKPVTVEDARRRVSGWLTSQGLRFPELVLDNGSGLSREERISADSLGKLLLQAWQSPVMPEFISSLPVTGIDGTMKKRLRDGSAAGRGHIKTGTLNGVKSIAGYVLDNQGQRHVVVFLINHPRAQAGQAAMDALLKWVVEGG